MQGRGLKPRCGGHVAAEPTVAPHAGAWIETALLFPSNPGVRVAPHAGAWIETRGLPMMHTRWVVAPHAGAWIETDFRH